MGHRLTSWFVTEKGKRFTFGLAAATSITIFSGYMLPHTWFMHKYKEIVQLYKSGIPVHVPETVVNRFNNALDLLEFPDIHKKLIKPFTIFGFEIFNCGTTYSKFGGFVGIPINFSYTNVEDIEKNDIMVESKPVHWSTEEGKMLLDSFVLSEKAQLFAFAREISFINSSKLILDTCYSTSVVIFMYGAGNYLNNKFNLYIKPTSIRCAMYSMIGCFGFGLYAFLTDFTQNYYDKKIDKELSEKHIIFAEGGKEFYEKLVQRNIALRKLLGPFGERKYSALGNENFFLRQKCVPVVARRDFFVNKLQNTL